ncbi:MAG: GNAT family N-acetyltransferase, partial [Brachymonas sp.]
LARGWSPNNMRPAQAQEELDKIRANPEAFLASLDTMQVAGEPVTMPDGSQVPRLPGFRRWMWDGEFCGSMGFRLQLGTHELPPYCLGHIGYTVVPWKRRLGYATLGLQQLLPEAKALGLPLVELTVAHDNAISKRVIEKCGGVFVEEFPLPACYGEGKEWRYRIALG